MSDPTIVFKGKDEVSPVVDKISKSLSGLEVSGKQVKTALAAVTAAAAGVGYALLKTLESTGQLADTAAQLGISATNLKNLQNASSLAGVGADELSTSLFKLKQNLGDALVKGTGPADAALKRLKLSAQDLSNLTLDQQFDKITAALGEVQNPAERATLSVALLGRQGAKIANLTEESKKLKEAINGVVGEITDLDISNIDAIDDAFGQVTMTLKQGMQKALSEMAPYILSMVNTFTKGIKWIKDNWDSILPVLKVVGIAIAALTLYFSPVLIVIGLIAAAFVKWPKVFGAVAQFILDAINNFIIAPLEWVWKQMVGIAAGLSAIAEGKNPIDAYNKATKEFKGLSAVFGDVDKISADLIEKAAKEKKEREANAGAVKGLNEEQKKALDDLDKTLEKLKQSNNFERDKLTLGEEQATITKRIAEEQAKLLEKGAKFRPGDIERITNLTKQEFAIKKQNEMWTAQKSLLEGLLNTNTPAEKLTQDIANLKATIEGKPIILPIKLETMSDVAGNTDAAKTALDKKVQDSVNSEVSKYNQLTKIKIEKEKALADIDQAIQQVKIAGGDQELIRLQTLEDAKFVIAANARAAELQAEIDLINEKDKIKNLELERDRLRMTEKLKMETDLLGGRLYTDKQADEVARKTADNKKAYEENATKFVIDQGADALAALGTQNKQAFEAY